MATYGDLKTRIIAELVRDDLAAGEQNEAQLANAIKDAIDEYRRRDWWFLTTTITTATVSAQNYVTRPTTIDRIQRVSIPALGLDLKKSDITELEMLDEPTASSGQPLAYAEYGTQLRIWPVPNAVFTIKITGTSLAPELSLDTDSNVWTNEAARLIRARAKANLFRFFRDDGGEATALREEALALAALQGTNIERFDMPICAGW